MSAPVKYVCDGTHLLLENGRGIEERTGLDEGRGRCIEPDGFEFGHVERRRLGANKDGEALDAFSEVLLSNRGELGGLHGVRQRLTMLLPGNPAMPYFDARRMSRTLGSWNASAILTRACASSTSISSMLIWSNGRHVSFCRVYLSQNLPSARELERRTRELLQENWGEKECRK